MGRVWVAVRVITRQTWQTLQPIKSHVAKHRGLNLNLTDTEHMLIKNARTPVITKIVDATGRPLKLQKHCLPLIEHGVHNNNLINNKIIIMLILRKE